MLLFLWHTILVGMKRTSLYSLPLHVKTPCLLSRADDPWKREMVPYTVLESLKVSLLYRCYPTYFLIHSTL